MNIMEKKKNNNEKIKIDLTLKDKRIKENKTQHFVPNLKKSKNQKNDFLPIGLKEDAENRINPCLAHFIEKFINKIQQKGCIINKGIYNMEKCVFQIRKPMSKRKQIIFDIVFSESFIPLSADNFKNFPKTYPIQFEVFKEDLLDIFIESGYEILNYHDCKNDRDIDFFDWVGFINSPKNETISFKVTKAHAIFDEIRKGTF